MLLALPDVPLRTGSFALEDRWLLWSRVRLYPDRLELTGWSWTGPHRRQIPLRRVDRTDHDNRRLLLYLQSGERVSLLLEEAKRWAQFIRMHRAVREDRN